MFDELRGGICILGCRFYLFESSEGGIFLGSESAWLWLRNSGRPLHLGKPFFKSRGPWMERQGLEGGIFSRPQGALSLQSLKEITHLRHFFENIVNNFHNTVFHSLFRNTNYFPN